MTEAASAWSRCRPELPHKALASLGQRHRVLLAWLLSLGRAHDRSLAVAYREDADVLRAFRGLAGVS